MILVGSCRRIKGMHLVIDLYLFHPSLILKRYFVRIMQYCLFQNYVLVFL